MNVNLVNSLGMIGFSLFLTDLKPKNLETRRYLDYFTKPWTTSSLFFIVINSCSGDFRKRFKREN